MKKTLLILLLVILSTFSIVAQSPCPTISVTAPNSLVKIGDSMTFTAKIDGVNDENLKYKWIVSNGEIVSGQGSLIINVATKDDMAGQTITAILEVSGLPQNCPNEFYGFGEIEPQKIIGCILTKLEEYGKISWSNEKKKLDELAKEIKKNEGMGVVFWINIKQKNNSQTFKIRKSQIENYLINKHKISKKRIVVVNAGNNENSTQIMFVPPGVEIPN